MPRSDVGSAAQLRELKTPSSPTLSKAYDRAPPSPTMRRHLPQKSLERNEVRVPPDRTHASRLLTSSIAR